MSQPSIYNALIQAFPQNGFLSHQIIAIRRYRNHSKLQVMNEVSDGYLKLTLSEIVTLALDYMGYWNPQTKHEVGDRISYMNLTRNKRIDKNLGRLYRFLLEFFEKLSHWWQGHGYKTTHQRAEELCYQLLPVNASIMMLGTEFDFRKAIFSQTLQACRTGYRLDIKPNDILFIDSQLMLNKTQRYEEIAKLRAENPNYQTQFTVVEQDTLDCLLELGFEKAVGHNFANAYHPGGGPDLGCPAQEEQFCYRSNYYPSLINQEYPLFKFGGIYTPDVSVFRRNEESRYAFMDHVEKVNLVACAAYDLRKYSEDRRTLGFLETEEITEQICRKNQSYMDGTKRKFTNMLRMMLLKGHTTAVLGAAGCGAFKNPPEIIAEIFYDLLHSEEFCGRFEKVYFAIKCGKNRHNIKVFQGKFLKSPDASA